MTLIRHGHRARTQDAAILRCRPRVLACCGVMVLLLIAPLRPADTAAAQERHERFERHEERFERREAPWRFAPRFGWRYEIRPGFWSPYYVWWWTGGQVILRPAPTVTIVRYPTGYYELQGDGFSVPYHWVWVPAVVVAPPPPPPAVSPGPPPAPSPPAASAPPAPAAPSAAAAPPPPPPAPAAPSADVAPPPPPPAPAPPVPAAPSASSAPAAAPPATAYWYYCPDAKAYYPSVSTCPEAWVKVPARTN